MSARQPSTVELLQQMILLQEQTNAILERQLVPLLEESNALRRLRGSAAVTFSPTPDNLTSTVLASGDITYGTMNIVSFPVYVPANGQYLLIMTPPAGYTIQIKRKLTATCDTYTAGIVLAQFSINGQYVLQPGLDYILDSPKTFESAVDILVGEQGIQALFVNPSSYGATVYIAAESLHLTNSFVNSYMQPALHYAYRLTQQVAEGGA
jgi:hypothetical protein